MQFCTSNCDKCGTIVIIIIIILLLLLLLHQTRRVTWSPSVAIEMRKIAQSNWSRFCDEQSISKLHFGTRPFRYPHEKTFRNLDCSPPRYLKQVQTPSRSGAIRYKNQSTSTGSWISNLPAEPVAQIICVFPFHLFPPGSSLEIDHSATPLPAYGTLYQ